MCCPGTWIYTHVFFLPHNNFKYGFLFFFSCLFFSFSCRRTRALLVCRVGWLPRGAIPCAFRCRWKGECTHTIYIYYTRAINMKSLHGLVSDIVGRFTAGATAVMSCENNARFEQYNWWRLYAGGMPAQARELWGCGTRLCMFNMSFRLPTQL